MQRLTGLMRIYTEDITEFSTGLASHLQHPADFHLVLVLM